MDEGPSEMDEDEWTDRNFGASTAEFSSDDVLDATDSEDDDQEDLLEEEALMTADETRKAAERWSRRHSLKSGRCVFCTLEIVAFVVLLFCMDLNTDNNFLSVFTDPKKMDTIRARQTILTTLMNTPKVDTYLITVSLDFRNFYFFF